MNSQLGCDITEFCYVSKYQQVQPAFLPHMRFTRGVRAYVIDPHLVLKQRVTVHWRCLALYNRFSSLTMKATKLYQQTLLQTRQETHIFFY